MNHGFWKSPMKHDKNKLIEPKVNTKKLWNILET
jgi:hypothetical protein